MSVPEGATTTFTRTSYYADHDGERRPIREDHGGAVTEAVVDTEYAPCARSPLGKMKRAS